METTLHCPIRKHCNGCQLLNLDYPAQLAFKQKKLQRLFYGISIPMPMIGMDNPTHYRNKCQFSFCVKGKKDIRFGLYQSKTRSVTPLKHCMLDNPKADAIAATVAKLLQSFKVTAYDYHRQTGFFRHVLVRTGQYTNQVMVVLVTSSPLFLKKKQFVNALLSQHPEITTVVQSVTESEKMVLGKRQDVLYGDGVITDKMLGMEFIISPGSFYQVNTIQAERMYQYALTAAALKQEDVLLDAYCGTGTIGLLAAKQVKQVIGVEQSQEAIRDAKENTRRNKIGNAHFVCQDATDFLTAMSKEGERADVVILDPPRAGSTPQFLRSLVKMRPDRIVYISCNPETQVKDLQVLLKGGYQIQTVQGFDLFPMTNHIESITLLTYCGK